MHNLTRTLIRKQNRPAGDKIAQINSPATCLFAVGKPMHVHIFEPALFQYIKASCFGIACVHNKRLFVFFCQINESQKSSAVYAPLTNAFRNREYASRELHGAQRLMQLNKPVKSVSDKEGAHSDDDYNDTIKQINYFIISGKDTRPYYITAIGEYILSEIKENAKTLLL